MVILGLRLVVKFIVRGACWWLWLICFDVRLFVLVFGFSCFVLLYGFDSCLNAVGI